MRSSRSVADPLDPGPEGFAHRGLHFGSGFPENSLIAFAAALELGAGIECDLRLTADDQILVFHDADAMRMCASPMRIGRSTAYRAQPADGSAKDRSRPREPAGAGRRTRSAASRGQGRWRYLAMGAGAAKSAPGLCRPLRRHELRSALGPLLKTNLPRRPSRAGRPRPAAAAQTPDCAVAGGPQIPRCRAVAALGEAMGRACERRREAGLQLDDPHAPSSARKPRFRPTRLIWEADGRP